MTTSITIKVKLNEKDLERAMRRAERAFRRAARQVAESATVEIAPFDERRAEIQARLKRGARRTSGRIV